MVELINRSVAEAEETEEEMVVHRNISIAQFLLGGCPTAQQQQQQQTPPPPCICKRPRETELTEG